MLDVLAQESMKVASLERIYLSAAKRPTFVRDVVSTLEQLDQDTVWHATWLLMHAAREQRLSNDDLTRIAASVDGVTHWAGRLTLCQMFAATGCPPALRDAVFPFLADACEDRRPIVRAWAISALWRFGDDEAYRTEIGRLIESARKDPSKSMQARLRQLGLMPRLAPRKHRSARSTATPFPG